MARGSATHPHGRATASDSQHVPHNCTLHGTRKLNAVPTGEDKEASPNQPGEREKNGELGAAPRMLCGTLGRLVVVMSCLCNATAFGHVTGAGSVFLLQGERNRALE